MNARPFDPQWMTSNNRLRAYLHGICANLSVREERQRRRRQDAQPRYEASIKSIILDLFRAHLSDKTLEVGIGTGTTCLQDLSRSRYGASFISARTFIDAMKALQEAGLVVQSTPHWDDPEKRNSRVARYMASPALLNGLREAGATVVDLCRHQNAEGIRLKDTRKALVEYGENAFATAARDRLRAINDMLADHWVDLALTDVELADELGRLRKSRNANKTPTIDLAARTVHRVFNNSDWEQGGRFYGAWWISCPSRLKPYILIDGKRTVEVDYSGLHAAMLFAEAGVTLPDDPYERCLTGIGGRQERQLVKRTFNALLNARHIDRIGEIADYSADLTGKDWQEFKQFIVNQYPEFQRNFGSGVDLRLQRKDSDLAEAVMLQFAAMGYACLPLHDSFIVHHGLERDLTIAMSKAFQAEFGIDGKVGVAVGLGEAVECGDLPSSADISGFLHPTGYEARLSRFRKTRKTS